MESRGSARLGGHPSRGRSLSGCRLRLLVPHAVGPAACGDSFPCSLRVCSEDSADTPTAREKEPPRRTVISMRNDPGPRRSRRIAWLPRCSPAAGSWTHRIYRLTRCTSTLAPVAVHRRRWRRLHPLYFQLGLSARTARGSSLRSCRRQEQEHEPRAVRTGSPTQRKKPGRPIPPSPTRHDPVPRARAPHLPALALRPRTASRRASRQPRSPSRTTPVRVISHRNDRAPRRFLPARSRSVRGVCGANTERAREGITAGGRPHCVRNHEASPQAAGPTACGTGPKSNRPPFEIQMERT